MSTTKEERARCWDELKDIIDNPNKPVKPNHFLGILLACITDLDERVVSIEKRGKTQ